ncbi:phosphorylase family protein [Micromonospora zhanjiangensis]
MTVDWTLFAAMRPEVRALRRGLPAGAPVRRTGIGPARAARTARRDGGGGPVAVAGIAGGLAAGLRTGDVVVATEVRADGAAATALPCPAAPMIAAALRRRGHTVHLGPVATTRRPATGRHRERLAGTGALAVDTESAAVLAAAADRPTACVRVVADPASRPLYRPGTLPRVLAAVRALGPVGPALVEWAAATTVRRVLLAASGPENPAGAGPATLRLIAAEADVLLVLGPGDPADARRLVEAAERAGTPAHLVGDVGEVDLRWLAGARAVGVTAGASAPPRLVARTVAALAGLGADDVRERAADTEDVRSTVPRKSRSG